LAEEEAGNEVAGDR